MGSDVYIFNLPPVKTCRPTKWCRENCYALKGNFQLPSAKQAAQWRYQISKSPNFVDLVVREIQRHRVRLVRLHSSGDFYGPEYIKKWIEIARRCPQTLFRTTTRRRDFSRLIHRLNSLPNFIIRESLDISSPRPTLKLPVAATDEIPSVQKLLKAKKIVFCPNNCRKCGYFCWHQRQSVCFAPH